MDFCDNTRGVSKKMCETDCMRLRIRSKHIVVIYVPMLTLLTGVGHLVTGYVSRRLMFPYQAFTGHSYMPELNCFIFFLSFFSFFGSCLRVSIACSLLGGGVTIPEQRLWGH